MFQPRTAIDRARRFRSVMTPPEVKLWTALRRETLGHRFRRQHPIGPYILDFYCRKARLAVEVDGQVHAHPSHRAADAQRDAALAALGVRTLRLRAALVLADLDTAVRMILTELETAPPPKEPPPSLRDTSP